MGGDRGCRTTLAVAGAIGLATGGSALAVYAGVIGAPDNWVGDDVRQMEQFVTAVAVAVVAASVVLVAVAVRVLRRPTSRADLSGVGTIAVVVVASLAFYQWFSERGRAASDVGGPGIEPVVAWCRCASVLMVLAWTALTVGSISPNRMPNIGRAPSALRWARIGNSAVTALGDRVGGRLVAVSGDGAVTRRHSPCGHADGGVLAIPGALLVMCIQARKQYLPSTGVTVVGLR